MLVAIMLVAITCSKAYSKSIVEEEYTKELRTPNCLSLIM